MLVLKRIKGAIVSYGMCSSFVEQILNSWATQKKIIPKDWKDLITALLESAPQLHWNMWQRDKARVIKQQGRVRGYVISQDQILGDSHCADVERHITFDDHILALCYTATLNAWDKIQRSGKKTEPFTKVIHGPKEAFTEFLQRLN